MNDLRKYQAKICLTAAGILVHQQKVLLVKHHKLGFWLAPGGHLEENELPHEAAEREFWEETGIKVKAVQHGFMSEDEIAQACPMPIAASLHWVCQENYQHRVNHEPLTEKKAKQWSRGCEQHYNLVFLVEPVANLEFQQNVEETDGIGWFSLSEIEDLEMPADIKAEMREALRLTAKKQ